MSVIAAGCGNIWVIMELRLYITGFELPVYPTTVPLVAILSGATN